MGTGFLHLAFTLLILIGIQAFLHTKLLISDTAENFHKCLIGLDIVSLRVSGYPAYLKIDVFHTHWILSSLCSTIGMTLVSPVILYFPSIICPCSFILVGL